MIDDYDPYSPQALADPHPIYRELRDTDPAYYVAPHDAWVTATHLPAPPAAPGRGAAPGAIQELLARYPDYDVDFEAAEAIRTEFIKGYASLPAQLAPGSF